MNIIFALSSTILILGFCLFLIGFNYNKKTCGIIGIIITFIGFFSFVKGLYNIRKKSHKNLIITTINGVQEKYIDCNYEIDDYKIKIITSEGKIIYYYTPLKIEELKDK